VTHTAREFIRRRYNEVLIATPVSPLTTRQALVELKNYFYPFDDISRANRELHDIRQNNTTTVASHHAKVQSILDRIPNTTDPNTIRNHIDSLISSYKPAIRTQVRSAYMTANCSLSFFAVCALAQGYENADRFDAGGVEVKGFGTESAEQKVGIESEKRFTGFCFYCKKQGHRRDECQKLKRVRENDRRDDYSFKKAKMKKIEKEKTLNACKRLGIKVVKSKRRSHDSSDAGSSTDKYVETSPNLVSRSVFKTWLNRLAFNKLRHEDLVQEESGVKTFHETRSRDLEKMRLNLLYKEAQVSEDSRFGRSTYAEVLIDVT
jgi:hypothetical protein